MFLILLLTVASWLLAWLLYAFRERTGIFSYRRIPGIFESHYLETKNFYMYMFKQVPCTTFINGLDIAQVYNYITVFHRKEIRKILQANQFNKEAKRQEFDRTIMVMENQMIIDMANHYVKILYAPNAYDIVDKMVHSFSDFSLPEKKEDFEINIITFSSNGLDLKRLDIKPASIDLALYYNDDFMSIDALIRQRLNNPDDKGIVLLHGLPGTGKTSYLRHLIGGLNKKVLFVSPSVAGNLMNPEFIDLLIDNPNSILVIEDAENIMMDRKYNSGSSVSNLLNLSDGLLSDCLNVQIICTFNSSLDIIDSALMRKGRLIAKYEFGKLTVDKAQKLSDHLGFDTIIRQPMTLADITNQGEINFDTKRIEVLGFRRQETVMN